MKEMKEMKGLPLEFMESGIQAKLDEIHDYRICFYDELHSEALEETFLLYSKDALEDGYALINEGIKEFYPNYCNNEYVEKVIKWYDSIDCMLLDLRIELMHRFNIKNPYVELRNRKEDK